MHTRDTRDGRAIAAAMQARLAEVPTAMIGALDRDGFFIEVPPSVPVGGRAVFQARHAVNLVGAAEAETMISAWEGALATGSSTTALTFVDGSSVVADIYDVRADHGAFITIVVASEGVIDPLVGVLPDEPSSLPRVCRLRKDARAVVLGVDDAVEPMLGWRPDELIGQRQIAFIDPDDGAAVVEMWVRLLARPGSSQRVRGRHQRRDGTWLWVEMINHNRLEDPEHADVACDIIDISEEMTAHQALAAREEMLNRLTESLPSGVAEVDGQLQLIYSNDRLFAILDSPRVTELPSLFAQVVEPDRDRLLAAVTGACRAESNVEIEARIAGRPMANGRVCQIMIRSLVTAAGEANGAVLAVTDVTDRERQRADLEYRATIDPLTQCVNRRSIMAMLGEAIEAPGAGGIGVLFFDVDRLKDLNDTRGHAAGDELLRLVAERLRGALRTGDVVGRLGGDEFLVVCPQIGGIDAVTALAERLTGAVSAPAVIADQPWEPSASFGSAWTERGTGPNAVVCPDQLVAEADAAMYDAKRRAGRAALGTFRTG